METHNMEKILNKINKNPLYKAAYNYILENNKSNDKPYHNIYHLLLVFGCCDDIGKSLSLNKNKQIELNLSALFHDFDHKGASPDSENIDEAVKGLEKFLNTNSKCLKDNDIDLESIVNLVKTTEFPHKDKELSISDKIIRDADLISGFNESWFLLTVIGLASEFSVPVKDQMKNQIKFISDLELYTDYAKEKQKDFGVEIPKKLNMFLDTPNLTKN